jgi:simple sugar transport system ATP-binding protein
LELRKGEIMGIAGVEGNGQKELVEIITGIRAPETGDINFINGRSLAYIPDDRHKFGMILGFTLTENIILGRQKEFSENGKLNYSKAREKTISVINEYDVRPDNPDAKAGSLSGGNQQKLVVGREMTKAKELILINQPTRGLDIKATEFVHASILDAKKKGKTIMLISSDLSELIKLCDKISVIFNGKITTVLDSSEVNEKVLGAYMLGIN